MSDLPDLAAFAHEVASRVGGEAHVVAEGEYPAMAMAIQGRHLVLLRAHHGSYSISLPIEFGSALRTWAEWTVFAPELVARLAGYRVAHPRGLSMADVILALGSTYGRASEPRWGVSFPGTPVPSEAWLQNAGGSIGLFQRATAVDVVVWVGDQTRLRTCSHPDDLGALPAWLAEHLAAQRFASDAAAAEDARKQALPLPDVAEVLARLRAGASIRLGGGRWSKTYYVKDGKLLCDEQEEADGATFDATEETLRADIAAYPDFFRSA